MHIWPHAQVSNQNGGGGLPFHFFENRKKNPDLGKKGPHCLHVWVKFSIQNVVLRVSRRKKAKKCYTAGPFFTCVFDEIFINCSSSTKPFLP